MTVTLFDVRSLLRAEAAELDHALEEVAARLAGLETDTIVVRSASTAGAGTISVIATLAKFNQPPNSSEQSRR